MTVLTELINSFTPHQWYLIGGLFAAIPGTIAITEWVKRHHYKLKAEKLWTGFVFINVTVWSFLLTAADAISANLSQATHITALLPQIAPFVSTYGPKVALTTLFVHTLATVLKKWWLDRKAKKPLFASTLPDLPQDPNLSELVQQVTAPVPATEQAAETTPPANVFQI